MSTHRFAGCLDGVSDCFSGFPDAYTEVCSSEDEAKGRFCSLKLGKTVPQVVAPRAAVIYMTRSQPWSWSVACCSEHLFIFYKDEAKGRFRSLNWAKVYLKWWHQRQVLSAVICMT